jgi:CheY-like chemotaxis protein
VSDEPAQLPPVPPPPPPGADEALYSALVKADRSATFGPQAAAIAHDLSELMTRILGAVSAARNRGDLAGLAVAEQAAHASRDLIQRLSALAKGGHGELVTAPARGLLEDAAKAGDGTGSEIEVQVADGTSPVRVDREQMLQAFRNLVRNAVEAMPPAPHRARIRLSAENAVLPEGRIPGLPAGDYVEFEVRDNGAGIAPEAVERIWEPFFTTRRHGSGFGLPAALAIIRRHKGQIGVDSVQGGGSVFTVFLPRARSGDEVRARRANLERFGTGRVLVMDDDEIIRAYTGAVLGDLGYTSDLACDGEEAVAMYRRYLEVGRPYDAVILDSSVARGQAGEAAFQALRELDPDVRAILAGEDGETAERCLGQGFCGWLVKPYGPADLGKVLGTVLG